MDELPIRPNKEYLEQLEKPKQKVVRHHTDFLRKSHPRVLPCAATNQTKKEQKPQKQSPSKKAIYEKIKSHNQMLKAKYQTEDPITHNKGKHSLVEQKVQKNLKEPEQPKPPSAKKQQISVQTERPAASKPKPDLKQKYENLLSQLNVEKEKLNQQREELENQKEYLEFKKELKNVEGLGNPLTRQMSAKKKSASTKVIQTKIQKKESKKLVVEKKKSPEKAQLVKRHQKLSKDFEESKKLIQDLNKKVEMLASNTKLKKTKNIEELLQEAAYQYTIMDIMKIANFTLDCINKVISLKEFRHTDNPFFKEFESNYQHYVLVKQAKQGAKSIKEFTNGCIEIELAKKYRRLQWKESGYLLTLFKNGDIKQDLPGPITMYFSKVKILNRINYCLDKQIFYFYDLGQIQLHSKNSEGQIQKEVRYKDGTIAKVRKID